MQTKMINNYIKTVKFQYGRLDIRTAYVFLLNSVFAKNNNKTFFQNKEKLI